MTSDKRSTVIVLGAEEQAASSLVAANPQRSFLLVSDQAVLDGWDLPNARFARAAPGQGVARPSPDSVALCARWLPDEDWSLSRTMTIAASVLGADGILPVLKAPGASGDWQVKGDRWHRPDSPMVGRATDLAEVTDDHGYGLVYQAAVQAESTLMTIGRRGEKGATLGLLRVFEERFFRYAVLQAAESIATDDLVERSLAVLQAVDLRGFFTLNWVVSGGQPRLSSIRPSPRATFGAFRRGGIDLLADPRGAQVLQPGRRFVAQPHYASYTRLES